MKNVNTHVHGHLAAVLKQVLLSCVSGLHSEFQKANADRDRFLDKTLSFTDQFSCPDSSLLNFVLGIGTLGHEI